ncbi:MAG: tRNA threonylcarbamoyladenosine dehydratase [Bacteroidales bacterium]|nr:tRNA threonylcarbamoyladenosine dehydratase [Bacteroidales bacterium]
MEWLSRTLILLGQEKIDKLQQAHVLVVGLGGVGAYAAEMIARAGIGSMTLVDGDRVHPSNRNRQLPALISTDNQYKAEVMADRIRDINPDIKMLVINEFVKEDSLKKLASQSYDYVVDAIDSLAPKIDLIRYSLAAGNRIISSMGAGGKMDPSKIRVDDISKTSYCPLAAAVRRGLRKFDIDKGVKVVYSTEISDKNSLILVEEQNKKSTLGTVSYLPAIFGCYCSSVVIRDLTSG